MVTSMESKILYFEKIIKSLNLNSTSTNVTESITNIQRKLQVFLKDNEELEELLKKCISIFLSIIY